MQGCRQLPPLGCQAGPSRSGPLHEARAAERPISERSEARTFVGSSCACIAPIKAAEDLISRATTPERKRARDALQAAAAAIPTDDGPPSVAPRCSAAVQFESSSSGETRRSEERLRRRAAGSAAEPPFGGARLRSQPQLPLRRTGSSISFTTSYSGSQRRPQPLLPLPLPPCPLPWLVSGL